VSPIRAHISISPELASDVTVLIFHQFGPFEASIYLDFLFAVAIMRKTKIVSVWHARTVNYDQSLDDQTQSRSCCCLLTVKSSRMLAWLDDLSIRVSSLRNPLLKATHHFSHMSGAMIVFCLPALVEFVV
jgi:hypothetical protein